MPVSRRQRLLGAVGRADDMHAIVDAETTATLEFLDDWFRERGGRRGRDQVRTATSGLTWAVTRHDTCAGDPAVHDHVLVANVVEMLDTKDGWKALEDRPPGPRRRRTRRPPALPDDLAAHQQRHELRTQADTLETELTHLRAGAGAWAGTPAGRAARRLAATEHAIADAGSRAQNPKLSRRGRRSAARDADQLRDALPPLTPPGIATEPLPSVASSKRSTRSRRRSTSSPATTTAASTNISSPDASDTSTTNSTQHRTGSNGTPPELDLGIDL